MPHAKPSEQDEASFMNDLLAGIDASFFDAVPSPDPVSKKQPKKYFATPAPPQPTKTLMQNVMTEEEPQSKKRRVCGALANEVEDIGALLEGAEGWDWDDMEDDFLSPRKRKKNKGIKYDHQDDRNHFTRCLVTSVDISDREKILHIVSIPDNTKKCVILKEVWTQTEVVPGDTINVIGHFTIELGKTPHITITNKHNLLILHPDILITSTSISNASHCTRRPILSSLLRKSNDVTPALVWGNILHEVVQQCLISQRWDEEHIRKVIDEKLMKGLEDLVKINVTVEQARTELLRRTEGLKTFGRNYIGDSPKLDGELTNTRQAPGCSSLLAIRKLLDVEEDIWSPRYGIKGKVDASIEVMIEQRNAIVKDRSTFTMPFEIKTGRSVAGMEHRAQTMLYTLLMAERYGMDVPGGLLYYTQAHEVIHVPSGWNEVRGLIMTRNEMASYLVRRIEDNQGKKGDAEEPFLPPTIDQDRICGRCYVADACMLYRKAVEEVVDNDSPISSLYEMKTGHLTNDQAAFFKKWERLITLEEQDMIKFRKELWTMSARDREDKGRCLSSMVIDHGYSNPTSKTPVSRDATIRQFTYRFVRKGAISSSLAARSLLNGHISSGDPVTVSVDPHLIALARGYVIELNPTSVVISVDHILSTEFVRTRLPPSSKIDEIVFRIDKDELTGGMARIRENLAQLFYVTANKRSLELIVDLEPPKFEHLAAEEVKHCSTTLNVNQRHAVDHILAAHDYALVLGMPGTGKTTTIAETIRVLVGMGKSVLLTSYTHSAVDSILLKLKSNADFSILRLGNPDKVHPDVRDLTLASRNTCTTVQQLEDLLLTPPVVATTCLSIDNALFMRRRFDYCIVDEASQVTLPTCLGPLRFASKFVLVGDHFQLPPLVKNRNARKEGLDVSLFRRLSDAHPHAVVDLAHQYRMNEDIMLLSNKLIYGDRLKCGSAEVANRTLVIPKRNLADGMHSTSDECWLQHILDESCKAVFVDTDQIPAKDSRVGDLIENEVEASLVQQLTEALIKGGVRQDQVGIISLYRQQIKRLSHLLEDYKDVEILTADRSQGRDKDCIIISLVRSNDDNNIGDLLKDWRRVNVAFTRARSKLVIFGSMRTLQNSPLLKEFFSLMEEKGWIFTLPPGAHTMHDCSSETLAKGASFKRSSQTMPLLKLKENETDVTDGRPQKKAKISAESGILRSRPILRDLANEAK